MSDNNRAIVLSDRMLGRIVQDARREAFVDALGLAKGYRGKSLVGRLGRHLTPPPARFDTVQRWMALDLWMAMGHDPLDFPRALDRLGFATLWAELCGVIRESRDSHQWRQPDVQG